MFLVSLDSSGNSPGGILDLPEPSLKLPAPSWTHPESSWSCPEPFPAVPGPSRLDFWATRDPVTRPEYFLKPFSPLCDYLTSGNVSEKEGRCMQRSAGSGGVGPL